MLFEEIKVSVGIVFAVVTIAFVIGFSSLSKTFPSTVNSVSANSILISPFAKL